MVRRAAGARWLRLSLFGLATLVAFSSIATDPADARSRRKKAPAYNPPYSDIVVDANTGDILHSSSPDAPRHPASLTKIMTLYLLFERLEDGRVKLNSPFEVSKHAAAQAPSKLGLRPGQTITAENAILALVTKSANDVAAVIAEALGGTESDFAAAMTRKARALGMTKTVYRNASGLPDDEQVTTARDQALLGRAIQERFPKYYEYFSTESFTWGGRKIANHNRLLGSVEGVDGIKTGYTRASGFNLVTSVKRDGRYIVSVVMGGKSSRSRDAKMRDLIGDTIKMASLKRTVTKIAEAPLPIPAPARTAEKPKAPLQLASAMPQPLPKVETTATVPQPGSTDPLKPLLVKTLTVRPGGAVKTVETAKPEPKKGILAPAATAVASAIVGTANAAETPKAEPKKQERSGWIIQVGAFPDEDDAKKKLKEVRSTASKLLAAADPFTETVTKGDKTLYRARFAGLDERKADAACRLLKRNDVACFSIKN